MDPSKPANAKPPDIASAPIPDTLAALHVNPDTGLTQAEVDVSRKQHGYNEVAQKKEHPVLKFLRKFWGISAWMLELIMVLSAVLRKFSDLAVVGALLVVNAVLSFMQEHRAAGVVEALRKRLQVSARVRRESNWQVIPARELVPGDIVRVRPGDLVPADVKLLTGALSIDESALTGESKDADKAPGGVLSSGSIVRRGEGNGVVMLTGGEDLLWAHHGTCPGGASEASHRRGRRQGRPLALRHRWPADKRGSRAVADPRRAAHRDGSAHARPAHDRGTGCSSSHVHGHHGSRVKGTGQARCAGHTP